MQTDGWKYYNHAAIPTTDPREMPDLSPIKNGDIWKMDGSPFLARWATDFDCGYETDWWYIIKDEQFDLSALKSNYRYKINKGVKYFEVRLIDSQEFPEELYRVQVAAFSAYPKKYRQTVHKDIFINKLSGWAGCAVFGAFFRGTGRLVGYTIVTKITDNWLDLSVQKTDPEYERLQLNAALVEGIMMYYAEFLKKGGIICDGSRSINHETHFQDYLEKYFGFRKAYCHLHVRYNPKIERMVKMLFPMRRILYKLDGIGAIHQINGVLKMEEICRKQNSAAGV